MRSLPTSLRRALLTGALAACTALAGLAPATATDIETARDRAQGVADRVTALSRRLAGLEARQGELDAAVERHSHEIGVLELQIHDTRARLEAARDAYVDRAVEAYKEGPGNELVLLLSARDLTDVMAIAEAAGEVAEQDAEALERLIGAARRAEGIQARLDARKQRLMAAQAEVDSLRTEVEGTIEAQSATLRQLRTEIGRLEEEARRRAEAAQAAEQETTLERALAPPSGETLLPYGSHPSQDGSGPSNAIPSGFVGTGVTFEGIASWYGPGFEGNLTANGDIFDPDRHTAASKELPLGSWLYVEHEGRGVIVLVNDRGPYVAGRVLDLSEAAAQAIGISGLGWIKAEVIVKTND